MRYYFDDGWADVEEGHLIDYAIRGPSDPITDGIDAKIWGMIEAQQRDAEATRDDAKYHEDI